MDVLEEQKEGGSTLPRPLLAVKAKKAKKEKNGKPRGTLQSHLSAGQLLKPVLWLIDHLVGSPGEDGLSPGGSVARSSDCTWSRYLKGRQPKPQRPKVTPGNVYTGGEWHFLLIPGGDKL